jgi:dTDP-glucose 4,6-dehydratase
MKKMFITGGAGFIGSAVVRNAVKTGYEVLNFDALTYSACLKNLEEVEGLGNYQFVHGDITNKNQLEDVMLDFKPDCVLHLAAESHVDRSIDGPEQFIQTNIIGTFNLLQVSRHYLAQEQNHQFKFLHVSTDEVFGSLEMNSQECFTESSRYDPSSPYSASKASSDHLARAWSRTFDLPIIITNCSNNYGPYQFPEKLIPVVILNALEGKPIPVYGAGQNVRDWLFVEDHVDALLTVLERGTVGKTYNIGGNNEVKNIDVVSAICRLLDEIKPKQTSYGAQIEFVADRPGHDMRYAIDASLICGELNWEPKRSLEAGLRETVIWYLENTDWLEGLKNRSGVGYRLGNAK